MLVAAVARTMRHPINWAMDAATFLFAWCVFLGGDIAMREDRLFCIALVTREAPAEGAARREDRELPHHRRFPGRDDRLRLLACPTSRAYRTFQGIPGVSYTWVTLERARRAAR